MWAWTLGVTRRKGSLLKVFLQDARSVGVSINMNTKRINSNVTIYKQVITCLDLKEN